MIELTAKYRSQLTQDEGVRAVVTMNEPMELLPNLFATPVTPRTNTERCSYPALPLTHKYCSVLTHSLRSSCVRHSSEEWRDAQVEQCFGATSDFSPPTLETIHRCVEFVHAQVDIHGRATYVHCKAGRGRSTVVVVAFLMRHRAMSLDDALAHVRAKRPHVSLHPKQRGVLDAYMNAYAASS